MVPASSPGPILVDDVLLYIFRYVLPPEVPDELEVVYRPATIVLSHVCHYWRHLVNTSPTLWSVLSHPIIMRPTVLLEFLDRSLNADLCVHLSGKAVDMASEDTVDRLSQSFQLISMHTHRLRTFIALELSPNLTAIVAAGLASRAPFLKLLHITSQGTVGSQLFGDQMPRLQDASIARMPILLLQLRGLTSLSVAQSMLMEQDIMLVARNCPDLQRLVCTIDEDVLSTVSDAMASSTVALNSLRVLVLWTKSPHGLRFLSRLSFPASTHIMLHYNSYSHQNAFNLDCSASMHTIISGITCMSVSGARKHAIQVVSPGPSDIQFRVAVERYDWCALQRSPHYTPFDALEFPALEQLHIRYAGAPLVLLDGDWAKILSKLPNLTRLSIVDADFSAYNVALALGHKPIWGGSHTSRNVPVICPLLQSIVINIERGMESGLLPGLARSLA